MSTKRGFVPAASAAFSSESINAAAAPCGAAQNTADVGSFAMSAEMSACDLNAVSPSTPARCGNDLPASSPGELSDITPASVKFGMAEDQAQQFARDVAGAAQDDGGNLVRP